MAEQPDDVRKGYRAAALRILQDIEEGEVEKGYDLSRDTKEEALLYLAEALVDLAESIAEGSPVGG